MQFKKLRAFTLTELVMAMLVLTIIVAITMPITKKKFEKVDNLAYYMAYKAMTDISTNVISQNQYDIDDWGSEAYTKSETATELCNQINDMYNTKSSSCNASTASVRTAATSGDFSSLTPHIALSNGLKLYIADDYDAIANLEGARAVDRIGYTIYVDANGASGKSKLYTDVFPFYLPLSGKTIPAYDTISSSGANNVGHLSFNVIQITYGGEYGSEYGGEYAANSSERKTKLLLTRTNFRTAACKSGYIVSATYCKDSHNSAITQFESCKAENADCKMIVNKPFRILQ